MQARKILLLDCPLWREGRRDWQLQLRVEVNSRVNTFFHRSWSSILLISGWSWSGVAIALCEYSGGVVLTWNGVGVELEFMHFYLLRLNSCWLGKLVSENEKNREWTSDFRSNWKRVQLFKIRSGTTQFFSHHCSRIFKKPKVGIEIESELERSGKNNRRVGVGVKFGENGVELCEARESHSGVGMTHSRSCPSLEEREKKAKWAHFKFYCFPYKNWSWAAHARSNLKCFVFCNTCW